MSSQHGETPQQKENSQVSLSMQEEESQSGRKRSFAVEESTADSHPPKKRKTDQEKLLKKEEIKFFKNFIKNNGKIIPEYEKVGSTHTKEAVSNKDSFLISDHETICFASTLTTCFTSTPTTLIDISEFLPKPQQLVHVKGGADSSELSHLFAPDSIPPIPLKSDEGLRLDAKGEHVRAELLTLIKNKTSEEFSNFKEIWLKKADTCTNWTDKMEFLLYMDKILLANLRNDKEFTEGQLKKYVSLKRDDYLTDSLIFKAYKAYLFKELHDRFTDACKLSNSMGHEKKDGEICNEFIKIEMDVLGKNLITDSLAKEIQKTCNANNFAK